jgi:beta-alanine degradation protein BauB
VKNPRRMFLGALFATVALFFVAGTALAQDPVKVSPDTHKVLLENDRVRVLDIREKPGQKAAMHSHPANVVYALTDFKIRFTYPDGKTEVREGKAGQVRWSEPVTHSGENVGSTELHLVQVELEGAATPAKK